MYSRRRKETRMQYYLKTTEAVMKELDSRQNGLDSWEAESRLEKHGRNKLAEAKKDSLFKRFIMQLADPMILVLIVAAAISGVTSYYAGESFADVVIIMAVVIINALLGMYQESKAEKAIEALQEMAAATSRVLRNGKIETVKSENLVPGDIVLLEAGDSVPADGRILESASLKIEEAALTGESVPVEKTADVLDADDAKDVPLGDRRNMVYMGSTVVYGRGKAVICETGMDTEMGKIAHALTQAQEGKTDPTQQISDDACTGYLYCYLCSQPDSSRVHRWNCSFKYLYGCSQSGCCCNTGRTGSSGNYCSFHWCNQYEQKKCNHTKADCRRNMGLCTDYLLR